MSEQLQPPMGRELLSAMYSQPCYEGLVDYFNNSVHGTRFDLREFSPETEVLQLKNVRLEAKADTQHFNDVVRPVGHALSKRFDDIIDGVGQVLMTPEVRNHRANGGAVVFATNHITYEDIPVFMGASTAHRLQEGEAIEDIVSTQNLIVSRLIGLFKLFGVAVVDDLILYTGNVIQTFPATRAGLSSSVPTDVRRLFNSEAKQHMADSFSRRDISFLAASGAQDAFDQETNTFIMGRVNQSTAESLVGPNLYGQDQLLVVPAFVRNQALHDKGVDPDTTDFTFLAPVAPHTVADVHTIHHDIATAGTEVLATTPNKIHRGKRIVYGAPIS